MLVYRVAWLKRFAIPTPAVGGCLIAVMLALADEPWGVRVSFDIRLKENSCALVR